VKPEILAQSGRRLQAVRRQVAGGNRRDQRRRAEENEPAPEPLGGASAEEESGRLENRADDEEGDREVNQCGVKEVKHREPTAQCALANLPEVRTDPG
jgi:hypothetical protein